MTEISINEKSRDEKSESELGEHFWSGLTYIVDTFRLYGETGIDDTFGINHKSITLSREEWEALNNFEDLKQIITEIWTNATGMLQAKEFNKC